MNCSKVTAPAVGSICPMTSRRHRSPEMRHNIFLILKEALTNALKHAGAKEVRVQAKAVGNSLEFLVQDDGRGFDSASPLTHQRHGLGNMRRRADTMGGTLAIESAHSQGTTIKLIVRISTQLSETQLKV